jgi:hypothetical protein
MELPLVDEHAIVVDVEPEVAWAAAAEAVEGAFSGAPARAYARAVRCADRAAGGPRPLDRGATLPGFHVEAAEPPSLLVLAGSHGFSTYELSVRVEDLGGGCSRVSARTRALFPGVTGALYRLAVIRSGAHRLGMRRLLDGIARVVA